MPKRNPKLRDLRFYHHGILCEVLQDWEGLWACCIGIKVVAKKLKSRADGRKFFLKKSVVELIRLPEIN